MTGRDLIIYILQNQLEDEQVYKDGVFLGFMGEIEAALYFGVGLSTIRTWYEEGMLPGIKLGNLIFIPANAKHPVDGGNNVSIT